MKIKIPDELRERIKTFLTNLDEAIRLAPENQATLADEISKLETDASRLGNEVSQLQREAVASDDAAASLTVKESRLRQINSRLEELRATLTDLKPVTLSGARDIIEDLSRFYAANLPDVIANFLAQLNLCSTRHKALAVAKQLDCYAFLHSLRTLAYNINSQQATPENLDRLNQILNRGLRGQPHLGMDILEAEAAK